MEAPRIAERHRRRSAPVRAAAVVLVALAAVPAAGSAQRDESQVTPADSIRVARVSFEGAAAFPASLLATAIVTAPTRCTSLAPLCWFGVGVDRQYLDARALAADTLRLRFFYYERGYRTARIGVDTAHVDADAVHVDFRIEEREPVRVATVAFEGAADLPPAALRNLPLAVGQPLSLVAFEATRDTLVARLSDLGYALADALGSYRIPADSPSAAHVRYELLAGMRARFGPIEVVGAEKVSPAVVRRMLTFRSGDVYSRGEILRSQRNLFSQELFRHAEIRAAPAVSSDTVIDVRVQVNEGDLHRVRAGLGLSTSEYLNAEGRWISRSFRGGARRLELRGRIANLLADQLGSTVLFEQAGGIYGSISGSLAADFTQPWFFGPLNTFNAGTYFERRSIPNVFVRTAGGGYFTFARSMGAGQLFSAGYRLELTKLETEEGDLIFCAGFVACGPDEIEALSSPRWLSPLTASYVRDRSNNIFAPTRGYLLRVDAELASGFTASDFAYTRLVADLADYHSFGSGLVLASRLRTGWAEPMGSDTALGVHPQKRFFAGGSNSVRGYAQYRLGPKLLTIDGAGRLARPGDGGAGCAAQLINDGSCDAGALAAAMPDLFRVQPIGGAVSLEGAVELRFPVFRDHVRGAAFLDFGQVWSAGEDLDFSALAWTPGLGVRYFSAVGPIRVDVGYNPGGAERVAVVTTEVQHCPPETGCEEIEPGVEYDWRHLRNTRTLQTLDAVEWNPRSSFLDRLQLHFSIGQAF